MENRRVVITGLGAVTSLGNDADTLWGNIKAGRCGIAPIKSFDASAQKVSLASEVTLNPTDYVSPVESKRLEPFCLYSLIAGREALAQSGISPENSDLLRCGVLIGSGVGGLTLTVREQVKGMEKGFDRVSPFFIPMSIINMAAGKLAIDSGFKGYCSAVVTACSGGNNAIGDAMRMIRHGYADVMLAGGTEGIVHPLTVGGFTAMQAMHKGDDPNRASIPFDRERSGFVMGDGAGVLVLEELEHARRRGANIIAELSGYGATCDAYHITAPEPEGEQATRAMTDAISDAGLKPEQIGYINAHGTSTPLNDKIETLSIKKALGPAASRVAVSSTKSMLGHLLGAAGAVEAVISIKSLTEGFIPPTINYREADPECDLDIVPNVGRAMQYEHALSNTFGFGGHNACLVFSKFGG